MIIPSLVGCPLLLPATTVTEVPSTQEDMLTSFVIDTRSSNPIQTPLCFRERSSFDSGLNAAVQKKHSL